MAKKASPGKDKEEEEFDQFRALKRGPISERNFRETKNTSILIYAIGQWRARANFPDNPPSWALDECRKSYEALQEGVVEKSARGPKAPDVYAAVLERVADLLTDPSLRPKGLALTRQVSLRSALVSALREKGLDTSETTLRRLRRLWDKDRDHRMERASVRYARKIRAKTL